MLRREEVEARFRALLVEEGVDLDHPTAAAVERAWAAMWRFRSEPVDGAVPPEGDWVSASYGVHESPSGAVHFELTMTRQIVFYAGDTYDVMMHLYCSFQYAPTAALRELGEGETLFDEPVDPDWTDALELAGYRGVRELGAQPVALAIEFTET